MAWLLLTSFFSVATVDVVAGNVSVVTVVTFSSWWALILGRRSAAAENEWLEPKKPS